MLTSCILPLACMYQHALETKTCSNISSNLNHPRLSLGLLLPQLFFGKTPIDVQQVYHS